MHPLLRTSFEKLVSYSTLIFVLITAASCVGLPETDVQSPVSITVENPIPVRNSPVISISSDARYIVYTADTADENGDGRQLRLRDIDAEQEFRLDGTRDGEMPFFSPDGKWIGFFSGGKLNKVSRETGEVITLVDAPDPAGGIWGRDGTIFYASAAAIWRISDNGGTTAQITRPETGEVHRWPATLPEPNLVLYNLSKPGMTVPSIVIGHTGTGERWTLGQGSTPRYVDTGHIVYSDAAVLKSVSIDIASRTIQGSPQTLVDGVIESLATGTSQYAIASDGSILYVPGGIFGKSRHIVLTDSQGKEHDSGLPAARYSYVRFSPDGQKLAIQIDDKQEDIWLYDRAQKTLTRLVENGASPVWTPDGKWVTFTSARAGVPGIFRVSVDGSNKVELVSVGEYPRDHSYDWSTDGTTLAYTEMNPETGMDIYLQDAQGTRPWLVTKAEECCPVFSPDKTMLAYVSDKSGRPEVYVLNVAENNPGSALKISTEGGREPLWRRDSNELLFWQDERLLRAKINTGNRSASEPGPIFQGIYVSSTSTWRTRYDYLPESDEFILIRRGPEEMGITELKLLHGRDTTPE